MRHAACCAASLWLALGLGCSSPPPQPSAEDDAPVREQFAALQAAVKDGDPERIWPLLHEKSQAEADNIARAVGKIRAAIGPQEKAAQEEALGLSPAEMEGLTGKVYLKSKRFRKRYDELPDSKIDRIQMSGDHATVHYLEPDGDKEKAIFLRQDGQWRAWLKMPAPEKK